MGNITDQETVELGFCPSKHHNRPRTLYEKKNMSYWTRAVNKNEYKQKYIIFA